MNLLIKTFKFRIYPNKSQQEILAKNFGCCRFVYNYFLNKAIQNYKENKKFNSIYDNQKELTKLKKLEQYSFLKEADSQALNSSLTNLGYSYSRFFKKFSGYPKFKKKSYSQSYTTYNICNSICFIKENQIQMPKIGLVKIKKHRQIEGRIVSGTISKTTTGKYYVSLMCKDCQQFILPIINSPIGIDLGIKSFLTDQNGNKVDNNKYLEKSLKSLKFQQRKLSRKQKGSKNYQKQRIKLSRKHEKISNQRKDFLNKVSANIIKNHDFICAENLSSKEMLENNDHSMSRWISDCSWAEFLRQLKYKSEWYGRKFIQVDKYFASSQLCSCCGYKYPKIKNLSIRSWTCPKCGVVHDRDQNAAINILNEGYKVVKIRV